MNIATRIAFLVGLILLAGTLAACATGSEAFDAGPPPLQEVRATNFIADPVDATAVMAGSPAGAARWNTPSHEPVIWVLGRGEVAVEPDLALLDLGVEVTLPTVAEARSEAAATVDAVMQALTSAGVADRDVQTQRFDIRPRYDWVEIEEEGVRSSRETLVGYRVSNRLSVKVRDMDTVSQVIDDVITAGGDSIRFRNLRFTVDDTTPLMAELRVDAVSDAQAKAKHYADLAGLTLGDIVYMAEPGASAPIYGIGNASGPHAAAALAVETFEQTSVSGGELEVSLAINVAFAVE